MLKNSGEVDFKSTWVPNEDLMERIYLLTIAIGTKQHIYKDIESIYRENELNYYAAYKQLDIELEKIHSAYPYQKTNILIQLMGIISYSYQARDFTIVHKIIQKGYNRLWRHIKNYGTFDFNIYNESIMQAEKIGTKTVEGISKEIIVADFLMLTAFEYSLPEDLFIDSKLVSVIQKQISMILDDYHYANSLKQIKQYGTPSSRRIEEFNEYLTPEISDFIKNFKKAKTYRELVEKYEDKVTSAIIKRIYEEELSKKNKLLESPVDNVTSSILSLNRTQTVDGFLKMLSEPVVPDRHALTSIVHKKVKEEIQQNDIVSCFNLLSNLSSTFFDFDFLEFADFAVIKHDDMVLLLESLIVVTEVHCFTDKEKVLFITFFTLMKSVQQDYVKLRAHALDGAREKDALHIQNIEKELKQYKQLVKSLEAQIRDKEKMWKQEIKKLEQEKQALQKQIEKKQDAETLQFELNKLRRYVATLDESEPENEVSLEEMKRLLSKQKIIIMGGHHEWQRKLMQELPAIEVVHVDHINRNFSIVDKYDYVFINTTVLNHGFYMKLMKFLGAAKSKLCYLSRTVNVDKTIREMYQQIYLLSKNS